MSKSVKIRRHLPLMGWMFALIAVAVALAAVKTQAPTLILLCGAMIGGLLINWRMSRSMVAGLELRRDVVNRVWQGQTVHLGYFLRNPKPNRSALGLTIEELAPEGIQSAAGYCVYLQAGRAFRAGARFVCNQRGRIHLGRARVSSSFPFGFVTARRTFEQAATLVVWPARGTLKQQILNRGAVETSDAAPSLVSGGQDEFFGLREYRSDDNPRWIHWRKSASRQTPVIREMSRPLPETLWVLVDTAIEPNDGAQEQAAIAARETRLSFAATLIDHAFVRGYQVGLALACDGRCIVLRPGPALAQRTALLDALAEVDDNRHTTLEAVIKSLPRGAMQKAQLVAVVPSLKGSASALSMLRGHCRHMNIVDHERLEVIFEPPIIHKAGPDTPAAMEPSPAPPQADAPGVADAR